MTEFIKFITALVRLIISLSQLIFILFTMWFIADVGHWLDSFGMGGSFLKFVQGFYH